MHMWCHFENYRYVYNETVLNIYVKHDHMHYDTLAWTWHESVYTLAMHWKIRVASARETLTLGCHLSGWNLRTSLLYFTVISRVLCPAQAFKHLRADDTVCVCVKFLKRMDLRPQHQDFWIKHVRILGGICFLFIRITFSTHLNCFLAFIKPIGFPPNFRQIVSVDICSSLTCSIEIPKILRIALWWNRLSAAISATFWDQFLAPHKNKFRGMAL